MSTPAPKRFVALFLLWGCLLSGLIAGCEPSEDEALIDGPATVENGFAIDFNYSSREMFGFNIEEYLQAKAAHLLPYAEKISHVAGEQRISPRALIALMELRSGAVTNPDFDAQKPFGDLSKKNGFLEQLRDVSTRLRAMAQSDEMRVVIDSPHDAILALLPARELSKLSNTYQQLFPGIVSQPVRIERATSQIPLQFPYPVGESWMFGGTHSDSGGDSPMSSIDFQKSGSSWGDTYSAKVVAAAGGKVKKYSSCYLTVIHSNNWSTGYYHLMNIMVADGATVSANQPIAQYANTKAQALCDGGSSTGPHVHWSLYYANNESDLSGKVLSGYTVHPGSFGYDENCSRMYYTKDGKKACPWTYVRNDGTSTSLDNCPNDPNKTEPGLCGCGVPEGTCPVATPRIEMSKSTYAVNEAIVVRYFNLPGNSTDWVGIYAAGAANTAELQYVYSNGAVNGTMQFTGRAAGKYEARLFFNDSYTLEAKVSFTVGSAPIDNCPSDPNKTEPGLCGCGVADTDGDKDGTPNCKDSCPSDPSKTSPGVCGCGVPEGTCTQGPSLSMSKSTYAVNETIKVNFSGMSGNSTDWIGLYKTGAAHTAYLVYQYTGSGKVSGTLSFAGRSAGSYEARLFLNDSYTLKKKVSFSVR
ncbi:MAG: peptidoglycan DD-metalloendopeptidase family protein [Myxococcota bacterium]|nr:peptidoglycan DD-metalloendopeptidase family protein [Myxococcota bacterium]